MRKYLRSIAKYKMKKSGVHRINRQHGKESVSYFSLHWREWCK